MLNKSHPLSRYKANSSKNKKNVWDILTLMLGPLFLAIDTRYNFCDKFSSVILSVWLHFSLLQLGLIDCMILMKENVSLTAAATKMGKRYFCSDHSNGCLEKKMLYWVIPSSIIQGMSPYPMDFLEIFTSGRYLRDTKILKILASDFKWFRVYGISKKLQIKYPFLNHTFLNTINLIWWKNELRFFLGSLVIFSWSQTIFQNWFY